MRHGNSGKTLGMSTAHRVAVLRNMAISLIEHGRVETTVLRAKALRGFIEPLITAGKKGDLAARRYVLSKLPNQEAAKKLVNDISTTFKERPGGYTRVLHLGHRKGDNASLALIEFVEEIKVAELPKIEPKVKKQQVAK